MTSSIFNPHWVPVTVHDGFIKQSLPDWALKTPVHKRQLLKKLTPHPPHYSTTLTEHQRTALNRLHIAHWRAHSDVEDELEALLDVYSFAQPLLQQALHEHYNIDPTLNLRETFVHLYIPLKLPLLNINTGGYKTWQVSLLDAALHNFEAFESELDAHASESGFTTKPTPSGQYTLLGTLSAQLPIAGFIKLCRHVDIGGQYQRHLEEHLGVHNKNKALRLRTKVRMHQRYAFEAAMHYARARGDISPMVFQALAGVGMTAEWTNALPTPLVAYSMKLLDTDLIGILVFLHDPSQTPTNPEVVVYLPDDPAFALKRYASMAEFLAALAQQLKNDSYQQYFSRFINHAQLGSFFSALKRSLWRTVSDPARVPEGRPEDFPPDVSVYPIEKPALSFSLSEIFHDCSEYLYQVKRQKILTDAPLIAVPTGTEDQKTRHDRKERLKQIAEGVLATIEFVAAPFIPVVGELMLAQMAWQMLDDTYEGIRDWTQGKTTEAWNHLFSVLEGAVQAATLAVGGKIIGDALAFKPAPFVDSLKRVSLPNNETRLWEPDLTPYRQPTALPLHVEPTETGVYLHNDAQYLSLDANTYLIEQNPSSPGYRIKHPSSGRAYAPRVRHNGLGAWVAETEKPLQWSDAQLFKRLSPLNSSFSDLDAARILEITHTDPAVIRRVVSDCSPTPALLADTALRFKIDADIERFLVQMESPDYALRRLADPQTQLQLLIDPELWHTSKALTFIDEQGNILAQYPSAVESTLHITILDSELRDGDLLTKVLLQLDDQDAKVLLGTSTALADPLPSMEGRIERLYQRIADLAKKKRTQLFNSRYQTHELHGNTEATLLQEAYPGLPTHAARELIWHASGDELLQLLNEKTIPIRLGEEARWQRMEARTNRAYEGLFLDSASNPDSEWLILKTLESLPGWPKETRLEIREDFFSGTLLNSLGSESAPVRKVLIKSENRYSARDALDQELHGPDELYSAVLHALPDAEREALGFPHPHQGPALKVRVRSHPLLPRRSVSQYLEQPVVAQDFKSAMELTHGRTGYPLLGADAPQQPPSSIESLVHQLYPSLNARERARVISTLPSNEVEARDVLAQRTRELESMRDDLEVWTLNIPAVNQRTGDILPPNAIVARVQDRRAFSRELERALRRQTAFDNHYADPARDGFELTFTRVLVEDMPVINADFSHVTYLSLNGQGPITGINEFLQHFPRLRVLELRNFELDRLPDAVSTLQNLTELRLENSSITLTPDSAAGLAGLEHLEYIDLDDNPLNITPDFSNMTNLNTVHLRNTELTHFPLSLLGLSEIEVIDLSENLITELPTELFEAPAYITAGLDLEDNPLSQESLRRVREYFAQTEIGMNIALEDEDAIEPVLVSGSED